MKVDAFVADRDQLWAELDAIVTHAGRRPQRLPAADVHRLGTLYRATAADLAVARRRWPGDPVVARLEQLVARARPAVYTGGSRGRIGDFVRRGYWRSVRERPAVLALAAVLLFGSAALTTVWAWRDPDRAAGLVPSSYRSVAEPHRYDHRNGPSTSQDTALAAEIMTNNIRVTFLAFGAGLLLGAGAGLVLLQNGVMLGAVFGLAISGGNGRPFIELVTPHGVLELSCIVVSAAAGLRIGWAIIAPGHRRRVDALVAEARAAVPMLVGTAAWLVVAGLVEGFITPAGIGLAPALVIGFGLGGLYWTLVALLGRPAPAPLGADIDDLVAAQSLAESFSLR